MYIQKTAHFNRYDTFEYEGNLYQVRDIIVTDSGDIGYYVYRISPEFFTEETLLVESLH